MESPRHPLRVVITGSSRGFGTALAASFARREARVFAGAKGERPALERVIAQYP
jgi:NAD(P)-dependent dehydrogenase (short-subunit alcohol dehydrogenase family)